MKWPLRGLHNLLQAPGTGGNKPQQHGGRVVSEVHERLPNDVERGILCDVRTNCALKKTDKAKRTTGLSRAKRKKILQKFSAAPVLTYDKQKPRAKANKTHLETPMTPLGPSLHALVATEPSGAAAGEKK